MTINPKDVYLGMKIIRNPEYVVDIDNFAYNGTQPVTVVGISNGGRQADTVDSLGQLWHPYLSEMDAYFEPKVETFCGFKVGDRVRLKSEASRAFSAVKHSEAVITAFTNSGQKCIAPYVWINLEWDRAFEINGQSNGEYDPIDFELIPEAPETPCKPFALAVGTLTFDSLESLSQAISEGVVTIAQVKTIRVKDGWVKEGDEVWYHSMNGPIGLEMNAYRANLKQYPASEVFSIKKPEYIPAKDGYYSGKFLE